MPFCLFIWHQCQDQPKWNSKVVIGASSVEGRAAALALKLERTSQVLTTRNEAALNEVDLLLTAFKRFSNLSVVQLFTDMAENTTLIVSAFSGLAGALITQALTGLFAYLGDKRKSDIEVTKEYRNKKVEIAENYYYVTGETMSIEEKCTAMERQKHTS